MQSSCVNAWFGSAGILFDTPTARPDAAFHSDNRREAFITMIGSRNSWQHYGHECQAPNHSPVQMIKEETLCRSYGTVEDGIRNLLGIVCCETSERFKLDRSQVSTIILGDDGYCGIFKHIWSCHHLIWSGQSYDKYGKSLIETVCQILVQRVYTHSPW